MFMALKGWDIDEVLGGTGGGREPLPTWKVGGLYSGLLCLIDMLLEGIVACDFVLLGFPGSRPDHTSQGPTIVGNFASPTVSGHLGLSGVLWDISNLTTDCTGRK